LWEQHRALALLFIERGAAVDVQSRNMDWTPLHVAAYQGLDRMAKRLVQAGAPVNARDSDGSTVLHLAVREESVGVVEVLLANGADLHAREMDGETALHIAAIGGNVDLVKLLLKAGARVNAVDHGGATALHEAAFMGFRRVARILRSHGANPHMRTRFGWSVQRCWAVGSRVPMAPGPHFAIDNGSGPAHHP
jgi:ankyrin repeat protein